MKRHAFSCLWPLTLLLVIACDDEGGSAANSATDAGSGTAEKDSQVEYQGVTRGGEIPGGEELPRPEADQGPFVVSEECCARTVSVAADGNETSARVVGNQPPFDGDGVTPTLMGQRLTADVCIPVGLAVQYRFEVQVPGAGGTNTEYRTDPFAPTLEDENGTFWNLAVTTTCDLDAGT